MHGLTLLYRRRRGHFHDWWLRIIAPALSSAVTGVMGLALNALGAILRVVLGRGAVGLASWCYGPIWLVILPGRLQIHPILSRLTLVFWLHWCSLFSTMSCLKCLPASSFMRSLVLALRELLLRRPLLLGGHACIVCTISWVHMAIAVVAIVPTMHTISIAVC